MKRLGMVVVAMVAACGGGGGGFEEDLDPDVVTNLPAGDGTGTAATADFDLESVTTGCDGNCTIDGGENNPGFSICDVGTELRETAHVEQTDGVLEIDVEDSEYVNRLSGGINADGSFEVGGYITQQGGDVEVTSREAGTIVDNTLTGTGRLQVRGLGLDCLIEVDLDGNEIVPP